MARQDLSTTYAVTYPPNLLWAFSGRPSLRDVRKAFADARLCPHRQLQKMKVVSEHDRAAPQAGLGAIYEIADPELQREFLTARLFGPSVAYPLAQRGRKIRQFRWVLRGSKRPPSPLGTGPEITLADHAPKIIITAELPAQRKTKGASK